MAKHHKYAPSSAERWTKCPGSLQLSEKVPKPEPSRYALEGTSAHTCLDTLLKAHIEKRPITVAVSLLRYSYPKAMVDNAIEVYKDVIARLGEGTQLYSEVEVTVPRVGFGTSDIILAEEFGTLTVADLKYGKGLVVEPEENLQALYYAIGAAEKFDYAFEAVKIIIYQPRAYHKRGPIREWITSVDKLRETHQFLIDSVKKCEAPNPKLLAGSHCRFCPAINICPEHKNMGLRSAQEDFM